MPPQNQPSPEAINGMLLDMLAGVVCKDHGDRRRRKAQGQAKAKAKGRYKRRPEDTDRNNGIASMLAAGQSWGTIQSITGCSRATIAKIAKRLRTPEAA
jgi:DNA invertase Pin-like site-specific DNA recombinase